jgi:hypothetical protein
MLLQCSIKKKVHFEMYNTKVWFFCITYFVFYAMGGVLGRKGCELRAGVKGVSGHLWHEKESGAEGGGGVCLKCLYFVRQ